METEKKNKIFSKIEFKKQKSHEHYLTEKPKSIETEILFDVYIVNKKLQKEVNLKIKSSSSIFSKKSIDKGTYNLLKYGDFNFNTNNCSVLDLGCGYGIIGLVIKKIYPEYNITMTDINERAIKFTKENCDINFCDCNIVKSNLFENLNDKKYDIIITNPPYSAGKNFMIKLLKESFIHLSNNGYLEIVIKTSKGAKIYQEIINSIFGNCEIVSIKSGYRILRSYKKE